MKKFFDRLMGYWLVSAFTVTVLIVTIQVSLSSVGVIIALLIAMVISSILLTISEYVIDYFTARARHKWDEIAEARRRRYEREGRFDETV